MKTIFLKHGTYKDGPKVFDVTEDDVQNMKVFNMMDTNYIESYLEKEFLTLPYIIDHIVKIQNEKQKEIDNKIEELANSNIYIIDPPKVEKKKAGRPKKQ
jgi:hypothetical protein